MAAGNCGVSRGPGCMTILGRDDTELGVDNVSNSSTRLFKDEESLFISIRTSLNKKHHFRVDAWSKFTVQPTE
jgi:hypothetical protein